MIWWIQCNKWMVEKVSCRLKLTKNKFMTTFLKILSSLAYKSFVSWILLLIWLWLVLQLSHLKFYGMKTKQFMPGKAIRYGEPISPYIFVFCMKKLSYMIVEATCFFMFKLLLGKLMIFWRFWIFCIMFQAMKIENERLVYSFQGMLIRVCKIILLLLVAFLWLKVKEQSPKVQHNEVW